MLVLCWHSKPHSVWFLERKLFGLILELNTYMWYVFADINSEQKKNHHVNS